MSEIDNNEFYTDRHKKLFSFASWANTISWIILAVYLLALVSRIFGQVTGSQTGYSGVQQPSFFEYIKDNPIALLRYIIDWINTIMNGIVLFLVLKGVSLGLNMIVETDLNYREKALEVDHAE